MKAMACLECGKPATVHIVVGPGFRPSEGGEYLGVSFCSGTCMLLHLEERAATRNWQGLGVPEK